MLQLLPIVTSTSTYWVRIVCQVKHLWLSDYQTSKQRQQQDEAALMRAIQSTHRLCTYRASGIQIYSLVHPIIHPFRVPKCNHLTTSWSNPWTEMASYHLHYVCLRFVIPVLFSYRMETVVDLTDKTDFVQEAHETRTQYCHNPYILFDNTQRYCGAESWPKRHILLQALLSLQRHKLQDI